MLLTSDGGVLLLCFYIQKILSRCVQRNPIPVAWYDRLAFGALGIPNTSPWLTKTRAWLPKTRAWLPKTRAWHPNTRACLVNLSMPLKTRAWLPESRAWLPKSRAWLPKPRACVREKINFSRLEPGCEICALGNCLKARIKLKMTESNTGGRIE